MVLWECQPWPEQICHPRLLIYKRLRRMELWEGNICYGAYRIGLGAAPRGPKEREGDQRTPEGAYYVCTRNAQSQYHLAFGLSYPNAADAQTAYKQGRVNAEQYQCIVSAIRDCKRPPWDTPLGGAIMIHGHGSQRDWTQGCIAVDDAVMDRLWKYVPLCTPVIVLP